MTPSAEAQAPTFRPQLLTASFLAAIFGFLGNVLAGQRLEFATKTTAALLLTAVAAVVDVWRVKLSDPARDKTSVASTAPSKPDPRTSAGVPPGPTPAAVRRSHLLASATLLVICSLIAGGILIAHAQADPSGAPRPGSTPTSIASPTVTAISTLPAAEALDRKCAQASAPTVYQPGTDITLKAGAIDNTVPNHPVVPLTGVIHRAVPKGSQYWVMVQVHGVGQHRDEDFYPQFPLSGKAGPIATGTSLHHFDTTVSEPRCHRTALILRVPDNLAAQLRKYAKDGDAYINNFPCDCLASNQAPVELAAKP